MMLTVRILALISCLLYSGQLSGQINHTYPRDTTFSVWSAYQKIKNDYPQASPVKEFSENGFRSDRDVVYAATAKRDLHLDVFYPGLSAKKKLPLIICIHGGGWASGNKSHLVPLAQFMAGKGFVVASIEYRLSPEAKYPAAILDIRSAISYLHDQSDSYGIDTSATVLLGTSAGATLANLVGVKYPFKISAIVNIDGILDFSDPAESGKDSDPSKPSAAKRWFGSSYKDDPELWMEASPVSYVGPLSPPTLFVNSSIPRFHAGRDQYLSVLKENDIYFEVHTIADTPHPFWLFHPWFEECTLHVTSFLGKVFWKEK